MSVDFRSELLRLTLAHSKSNSSTVTGTGIDQMLERFYHAIERRPFREQIVHMSLGQTQCIGIAVSRILA